MNKNTLTKYLRIGLLALFLILITIQAYLHQVLGGAEAGSIHALCPYGGLETLYKVLVDGTFIQKIFSGTLTLFIITLALALLFGRSFCGLICPFGALQEFFAMIGKKVFKKRFTLPEKIDTPLRFLKYVVLVVTIFYAWTTTGLWMDPYDPWAAYGHLSEGVTSLLETYPIGFALLIITVIGSLLYDRFFCKYICPMGAIYGIISKISPSKIVRNENTCINCNRCSKICPMNIDVASGQKVTSAECINCQICVISCPKQGALENKIGSKIVQPFVILLIIMALFWGTIGITKFTGILRTTPKPITAGVTITVDEIRGYMTLQDVAKALNIDLQDLYKKLGIPETVSPETKFKEVGKIVPGFTDEKAKEILRHLQ